MGTPGANQAGSVPDSRARRRSIVPARTVALKRRRHREAEFNDAGHAFHRSRRHRPKALPTFLFGFQQHRNHANHRADHHQVDENHVCHRHAYDTVAFGSADMVLIGADVFR